MKLVHQLSPFGGGRGRKLLITFGMMGFLLCSCQTQKSLVSENKQENRFANVSKMVNDSVIHRRQSEIKIETVQADTAKLNLNPADIAKLPPGASFYQKSGRATINIRQTAAGNMDIIATCDSLNILYENLTIEYERYRKMSNDSINILNKEITKIKTQSIKDPFWVKMKKVAMVIMGIVVLFFIIDKGFCSNSK